MLVWKIGIGGWVAFEGQPGIWFAESFQVSDFTSLGLPMKAEANLDIVSYETGSERSDAVLRNCKCWGPPQSMHSERLLRNGVCGQQIVYRSNPVMLPSVSQL